MLAKRCDLDTSWLLGGMGMIGARIDLEFPVHRVPHLGLRKHAADGFLHETNRLAFADDAGALLPEAAFITTVPPVDLLIFLTAGQLDRRGIHDDDVIPPVDVRGVNRLVLALEEPRGER